jgi:anti-sigma regulatory factor (Ser/Thr protein kinase)
MCQTTDRAELVLPLTVASPGAARAFARASSCTEHAPEILDDALLLISELVTNAVRYGEPPLLLALECEEGGLRVRVRDSGASLPRPRVAADGHESGRGLDLVELLSDVWGVEPVVDDHGSGKVVWFTMPAPAAPPSELGSSLPIPPQPRRAARSAVVDLQPSTARDGPAATGRAAWASRVAVQVAPPDVVARIGDLGYAGRYVPTDGTDQPIAGDFYDVLTLADDLIAVCVGDVAGHGPTVLPQMQTLRVAVRDTAQRLIGPVAVVAALDAYWEGLGLETLATLWYGEYRLSTGELTYVSAGHPPPVLTVHGDPTRLLALASAPPLGVGLAHQHAANDTEVLPVGSVLVAYSDGLVERRTVDLGEQIAALQEVVTAACDPARAGSAREIASEILDALVPDPDRAEDDVCVLVVVRREPARDG